MERVLLSEHPIQIKQASLSVLIRIAQLEAAIWKEMAADQAMLKKRFRRFPAGFLIAETGPVLAGFCMALRVQPKSLEESRILSLTLENHDPQGTILFLLGLTVDPVFRSHRIGSRLAQAEVDLAVQLGCSAVALVANRYSQGLFERLGFRVERQLDSRPFAAFPGLMPEPTFMLKTLDESLEPEESDGLRASRRPKG